MTDSTLPLKDRVRGLATVPDSDAVGKPFEDAVAALLADIAACERLAKAAAVMDGIDPGEPGDGHYAFIAAYNERHAALAAYREAVNRG